MISMAGDLRELVTASGHLVNTYGVRQETVFFPRYSQLVASTPNFDGMSNGSTTPLLVLSEAGRLPRLSWGTGYSCM